MISSKCSPACNNFGTCAPKRIIPGKASKPIVLLCNCAMRCWRSSTKFAADLKNHKRLPGNLQTNSIVVAVFNRQAKKCPLKTGPTKSAGC